MYIVDYLASWACRAFNRDVHDVLEGFIVYHRYLVYTHNVVYYAVLRPNMTYF